MGEIRKFEIVKSVAAEKETNEEKVSGPDVIKRLKEALAMAEDGLLDNVLILAVMDDGSVMDSWANDGTPFTVVGGLESLKRAFMDRCIEKR